MAFDLLLDLPASPPHGIAFGSSLRYWTEAALFSLALITEEQFIPTIRENAAVWTAVIAGDDVERVHTLADAMPAYCRALIIWKEGRQYAQDTPPRHIIRSFIDQTVDVFVRRSLESVLLISPRRGRRPRITPMPEQFLSALSTGNPALDAPVEAVAAFSGELEGWLTGLQPAMPSAPFRTCFRLDAPPDPDEGECEAMDGGGDYDDGAGGEGESGGRTRDRDQERDWNMWSLGFFLQAKDDPSLLIPAEKVWKTRSETLTFLKRKFKNPQEQLLADLGRASQTYPPIEKSLQDARPVGFDMSAGQAYSFLREFAPLLEQNGFGVLLPPWWEKPGARLGVKLKIKTPSPVQEGGIGSGHFSVKSIMSYDWTVAIGDKTLSIDEFKCLASLKIPLVKVRGEWVELRAEDIETAINFFEKKHKEREITLGEAMRLGLGAADVGDEIGLPVVGVETEGWLKEMLSKFSGDDGGDGAKITLVDQPGAFNGVLRPYQAKGVSWLAYLSGFGFGACLADDMGLGKTVELIAFLLHVREEMGEEGKTPDPTLLICPMSVVGNWRKEVERFAPSLGVMIHHGADRLAGRAFAEEAEKHDLVISTYSLAHRDEDALSQVHWRHIVLDEAQNIKNPAAKQTQAISIDVRTGVVKSKVRGSGSKPYSVTIKMDPISDADWEKVADAMASKAIFAAKLLAGEMPTDIEDAFAEAGISLFPVKLKDLETDCSCPDWANPCKHIAAVYYLLAERFDEDPFLIFKLRGRTKEDIIDALRKRRVSDASAEEEAVKPLDSFSVNKTRPEVEAAVLRRLGDAPFFISKYNIAALLSRAYTVAGSAALQRASGEVEGDYDSREGA